MEYIVFYTLWVGDPDAEKRVEEFKERNDINGDASRYLHLYHLITGHYPKEAIMEFAQGANYGLWVRYYFWVTENLCYLDGESALHLQCFFDWNHFFGLGYFSQPASFAITQVALLLLCFIVREYQMERNMISDDLLLPDPKLDDERDFTVKKKSKFAD